MPEVDQQSATTLRVVAQSAAERSDARPDPIITVCVDLGSSKTKVVYRRLDGEREKILLLDPHVREVDRDELDRVRARRIIAADVDPENDAWGTDKKNSDRAWVVGSLVQDFCFGAIREKTESRKAASGTYKVLAALGAIAQRENLRQVELHLQILLPFDEHSSAGGLIDSIKSNSSFYFRDTPVRVKFSQARCLPEGMGVMFDRCRQYRDRDRYSLFVVMLGHRNISTVFRQRGQAPQPQVFDSGFRKLVANINALSHQDEWQRARALSAIGSNISPENPALIHFCEARGTQREREEVRLLSDQIASERARYWRAISELIGAQIKTLENSLGLNRDGSLRKIDEVTVVGGPARYFSPEIQEMLEGQNTYQGKNLRDELFSSRKQAEVFPLVCREDFSETSWQLIDCYAAHRSLRDAVLAQRRKEEAAGG